MMYMYLHNKSLKYLIDDYIDNCKKTKTLYDYISDYINFKELNPLPLHTSKNIESRYIYIRLKEKCDKTKFDFDYLNGYLDLMYYEFIFDIDNIMYQSMEFKNWCKTWQKIYNKFRNRRASKAIEPYQIKFLKKLYNPHTVIGKKFMIKKINELPWIE